MYLKPSFYRSYPIIILAFMSVAIVFLVLRIPSIASFENFAFGDAGASLRADYIISQGYRPSADFSYAYGLLTLVVGRAWFWLFGRTSFSYVLAMIVCQLLFAWGVARFARNAKLKFFPLIFLLFCGSYCFGHLASTVYALEPIFVSHALAEHAAGRRDRALILSVISIFVKPSMGIIYSAVILLLIAISHLRRTNSLKRILKDITPAALIGSGISISLIISFGFSEFFNITLPFAGKIIYKANNFGFFSGVGSSFWKSKDVSAGYYLGNPIGFWLVLSGVLSIGGLASLYKVIKNIKIDEQKPSKIYSEVVVSCFLCWIAWILFFFAHASSWFYYTYMMLMGVAVILNSLSLKKLRYSLFCSLLVFSLLSQYSITKDIYRQWTNRFIGADTHWLWFDKQMYKEWQQVVDLIQDKPAAGALFNGCLGLIDERFSMPHYWMMLKGETHPKMLLELDSVISQASYLVLLGQSDESFLRWYAKRPSTRQLLNQFEVSEEGKSFKLLSRISPTP
jgi:hypothetical protein